MASQVEARNHQKSSSISARKLNQYLEDLAQAEAASTKRNQELLADINEVAKNAQRMSIHTQHLKSVRDEYENYFNRIYPTYMQQSGRNSTLETGSVRNKAFESDAVFHSTPLHTKNENVPTLSLPQRCKGRIDELSSELRDNENIPPISLPERSRQPTNLVSVELEDEDLQTQYQDFIRRKMGSWRTFPSLPDDINSTIYRTNDKLIELLQDRINKCELHLRDLGSPVVNKKELDRNLDIGFRTSKRALREIEIECERLKSEYISKYGTHTDKSSVRNTPHENHWSETSPRNESRSPRNYIAMSPPKRFVERDSVSPLNRDYLGESPLRSFLNQPQRSSSSYGMNNCVPRSNPKPHMDLLSRDFLCPLQKNLPSDNLRENSQLDHSFNANHCHCNSMNKSTYSNEDSSIRIIPQLLGLSPEGQLVLLPMAQPLKGTLHPQEISPLPEHLHAETRSSPVGQSSVLGDGQNKIAKSGGSLDSSLNIGGKDLSLPPQPYLNIGGKNLSSDFNGDNLSSEDIRYYTTLGCNKSGVINELLHEKSVPLPIGDSNTPASDQSHLDEHRKQSEPGASPVVEMNGSYINLQERVSPDESFKGRENVEVSCKKEKTKSDTHNIPKTCETIDPKHEEINKDHNQNTSGTNLLLEETTNSHNSHDLINQAPKNIDREVLSATSEEQKQQQNEFSHQFLSDKSQNYLNIVEPNKLDSSLDFEKSLEIEKSVSQEKSIELDNLIELAKSEELDLNDFDEDVNELNKSNNSIFSGFSEDGSEFNLPSSSVDVKPALTNHSSDYVSNKLQHSNDIEDTVKDEIDKNHNLRSCDYDPGIFSFLIDKLMERVQDDESEEVLVLNLEMDLDIFNEIMSAIKTGRELARFDASQICMVYRYQLENCMKLDEKVFISDNLDPSNDFEGHLRDCIEPCYLDIWDSLFAFLSTVMEEFDFDPTQVASIYASALVPNDEKIMLKLQTSLANILYSLTTEGQVSKDDDDYAESAEVKLSVDNLENSLQPDQSVSITEDFSRGGGFGDNKFSAPELSTPDDKNISEKGDLSKTLSVERSPVKNDIDVENDVPGGASKEDDMMNDSSLELGSVSLDLSQEEVGVTKEKEEIPLDGLLGSAAEQSNVEEDMSALQKMHLEASFDLGSMSSEDSDSEDSGDMSFDSDGLPVPKSPRKKTSSKSIDKEIPSKEQDHEGERLDVMSPSYQKMRQESIASPIDDDDDDLDNMLGESLGLSSKSINQFRKMKVGASLPPQPTTSNNSMKSRTHSHADLSQGNKTDRESPSGGLDSKRSDVTSPLSSSAALKDGQIVDMKAKLKKPGFWNDSDEESGDEVDINQISKAATVKSNDDDDDFDFDFYD